MGRPKGSKKFSKDDLSGYDYECPIYKRKDKTCAITLEFCPRFNPETNRSPDGNCKVRVDSFKQYLIDKGLTTEIKEEDKYELIIEKKKDNNKMKSKIKNDDFIFV